MAPFRTAALLQKGKGPVGGRAAIRAVFGDGPAVVRLGHLLLVQQERLASSAGLTVEEAVGYDEPMVARRDAEMAAAELS